MLPVYRHTDGRLLRLGKKPPKNDPRTLKLQDYLRVATAPTSANWFGNVTSFGMMLNSDLGDCTCAAAGHAVQVATLNTPTGEVTPPDSVILRLYEKTCGYVPGDPSTDQGGVIVDVLNYVRNRGIGMRKHKPFNHNKPTLYAYADPNVGDVNHIKQAIATFGIVDIGLQLPISAQSQVGGVWDVVGNPNSTPNSQPGSWGGHSVVVCAYTPTTLTCITWGQLQTMTWPFWAAYVDEGHALLMQVWINRFSAQSGMNLSKLNQALQALNG